MKNGMIFESIKQDYRIAELMYRKTKQTYAPAQVMSIAAIFDISGKVVGAYPYENGHINDTFAIVTSDSNPFPRYIILRAL